jgi:hypothetical protein
MSEMAKTVSPVIAAGSRFPVGAEEPVCEEGLSPVERRSFLLRGAEPVGLGAYPRAGATPKTTTGYDGQPGKESEDFNLPDFAP